MKRTLLITAIILLSTELSCFVLLKRSSVDSPFLFGVNLKSSNLDKLVLYKYDEIDPVLGWSIQEKHINEKGYKTKHKLLLLDQYSNKCGNPYTILITGGSTSDLMYNPENWPIYFEQEIVKIYPCYEIYIGAIGGYDSGQELLQLLKFQYSLTPDLHISYSACNDYINQGLASRYENNLWQEFMTPKTPLLFPSSITWLKKKIKVVSPSIEFTPSTRIEPSQFWINNQNSMKALALQKDYTYLGVLQPVINYSGYALDLNEVGLGLNLKYLQEFESYYPELIAHCKTDPMLYDFTLIFENATEHPFSDDCHLKDKSFQRRVSASILDIVKERTQSSE